MQVTVYEVQNGSKVHEVAKEVNENCGAITVDSAFLDFLKDLLGILIEHSIYIYLAYACFHLDLYIYLPYH